ncbi:EspF repeat-containing protein [Streptomyces sp. NPDC017056]
MANDLRPAPAWPAPGPRAQRSTT